MVTLPTFLACTANINGEGGTVQYHLPNNQVHTTPHPVLLFLGICMGPVQ